MSTIDLGKIKFVWRGAYNNGTAYTPDDVVSSGGSSYICIAASTGNAVSNGTYWQQMSAAGTNGTDLTSTLGTQGQIVYRDGSGLAALNPGTSGQVLQTGGSGANPSWTAVASGNTVKLGTNTISSNVNNIVFDGLFNDSVYSHYELQVIGLSTTNDSSTSNLYLRMYGSTGTSYTGSDYYTSYITGAGSSGSGSVSGSKQHAADYFAFSANNLEADIARGMTGSAKFYMPQSSTHGMRYFADSFSFHGGTGSYYNVQVAGAIDNISQTYTGFVIYPAGGQLDAGTCILYGVKK